MLLTFVLLMTCCFTPLAHRSVQKEMLGIDLSDVEEEEEEDILEEEEEEEDILEEEEEEDSMGEEEVDV